MSFWVRAPFFFFFFCRGFSTPSAAKDPPSVFVCFLSSLLDCPRPRVFMWLVGSVCSEIALIVCVCVCAFIESILSGFKMFCVCLAAARSGGVRGLELIFSAEI